MKNNYTAQCMDKTTKKDRNAKGDQLAPGKQTLMFLSQFACVYHAEPTIPKELCGFILN